MKHPPDLPEKCTWYGRPSDPFVRVVETYKLSDDGLTLHIQRDILPKGVIGKVDTKVRVE